LGGAERAQRKRRQATRAVVAAKPGSRSDRGRMVAAIVVVLVLAAAVFGGVWWQRSQSEAMPQAPAKEVAASYPVQLADRLVVAGADSAKVTVDVYEDFLCPACGAFEARYFPRMEEALQSGSIKVRYHLINMLDDKSNPPGYSLEAASAAMCAVPSGKFMSYHGSLYATQPSEGGPGYTVDQLVQLGRDLRITDPSFEQCVRAGTYKDAVRAELAAAENDPSLRRSAGGGQYFGTPTVVVNGSMVDLSDAAWLDKAISAAG
jgi:protein-disulfide isomerase